MNQIQALVIATLFAVNVFILLFSLLMNFLFEKQIVCLVNLAVTREVALGRPVYLSQESKFYFSPSKALFLYIVSFGVFISFLIGQAPFAFEEKVLEEAWIMKSVPITDIILNESELFRNFKTEDFLGSKPVIDNPCLRSMSEGEKWFF